MCKEIEKKEEYELKDIKEEISNIIKKNFEATRIGEVDELSECKFIEMFTKNLVIFDPMDRKIGYYEEEDDESSFLLQSIQTKELKQMILIRNSF